MDPTRGLLIRKTQVRWQSILPAVRNSRGANWKRQEEHRGDGGRFIVGGPPERVLARSGAALNFGLGVCRNATSHSEGGSEGKELRGGDQGPAQPRRDPTSVTMELVPTPRKRNRTCQTGNLLPSFGNIDKIYRWHRRAWSSTAFRRNGTVSTRT